MDEEKKVRLRNKIDEALELQKIILEEIEKLKHSKQQLESKGLVEITNNVPGIEAFLSENSKDVGKMFYIAVIIKKLESAYIMLEELVNDLELMVKDWKKQFQLYYASLMLKPELEELAHWCAETGKLLYDLLYQNMVKLKEVINSVSIIINFVPLETKFRTLMIRFLRSTFIVTKQENFYVKTKTEKFQDFHIRILAADYWYSQSTEVKVHFIAEYDLRKCIRGDDLDLQMMKSKTIKLKVYKKESVSRQNMLKTDQRSKKMECHLQNLTFENFKRTQSKGSKQIHEEKFRMIFVTEMESTELWLSSSILTLLLMLTHGSEECIKVFSKTVQIWISTMCISLPLVVISASSQEANGLASIMWQCSSTDVFAVEEMTSECRPLPLPWIEIAKMLKRKFSILSNKDTKSSQKYRQSEHQLSDEHLKHLKNRLFGEDNVSDDETVDLNKFCCIEMKDTEFSFWRWFLGIYNLVDQYLSQYWEKGLINGFLKKEDAEQMLLKCKKGGTFLLRFSDTNIVKRDGVGNTLGYLTAATVVCKKYTDTELNSSKRKITGSTEVVKETGHKCITDKSNPPINLANNLRNEKEPIYRWLYPGDKSREEVFDKYCTEESPLPGYTIFIEGVRNVQINEDNDANATDLDPSAAIKKPRCITEQMEPDYPTNHSEIMSSQNGKQNGMLFPLTEISFLSRVDSNPEQTVPGVETKHDKAANRICYDELNIGTPDQENNHITAVKTDQLTLNQLNSKHSDLSSDFDYDFETQSKCSTGPTHMQGSQNDVQTKKKFQRLLQDTSNELTPGEFDRYISYVKSPEGQSYITELQQNNIPPTCLDGDLPSDLKDIRSDDLIYKEMETDSDLGILPGDIADDCSI